MLSICFYFQVHQPYRLRRFQVFDVRNTNNYFDEEKNKAILNKVAGKCYLPTNQLLLDLCKHYPEFKISFSFSGVLLDQLQEYAPQVLESFQKLVNTGQVEILAETYYHSLSLLYSKQEFQEQIKKQQQKIKSLFDIKSTILRNTELIYNNELACIAEQMGFKGVLIEGADKILGWRSPNFLYKAIDTEMPLLLKNYRLSDDIAFRFSDRGWQEHPLMVEKYAQWINATHGNGNTINLFMDYETFGEHQWEDSGIFNFFRLLPEEILKHSDNEFVWPSELVQKYQPVDALDIPDYVSWADIERDVSAWLGNDLQQSAITQLYELENIIKQKGDENLLNNWRKLQTSDHFYYMCTKWFNDGDVHKYFNPYDSPYEGFIYYMNVLKDLKSRL
ncbi:MAG: glycoside hydrolase family 57 protein [Candidatus Babeliales bacterium]